MKLRLLLSVFLAAWCFVLPVNSAELSQGHWFVGGSLGLLELDDERDGGQIDFGPDSEPWMAGFSLGYRYQTKWDFEFKLSTNVSGASGQHFELNTYRYWGDDWRFYLMGGLTKLDFSDLPDNRGDTTQAQLGVGLAKALTDNWELKVGLHHLYDVGAGSYSDEYVGLVSLNYHFGLIRAASEEAAVTPPPAMEPKAQPESVPVDKMEVMTVELRVEFDTDKWDIRSLYQDQFDRIGNLLNEFRYIDITIEGHTDWRASEDYNQVLSENRSNSVKERLVQAYGIDPERITTIGFGELRPIATNETVEGMQRNRRAIAVFTVPKIPQ